MKVHFTKRVLESLPIPARGRVATHDAATSGLGVMVHASGLKSFFWFRKIAGSPKWETIGAFPELTIELARARATELNNTLAAWRARRYEGQNPFQRRNDCTLSDVLEEYIAKKVKQHFRRPVVAERDLRSLVRRYMPFVGKPLGSISREDVSQMHRKIGEKYRRTANVALKTVKVLFNFAEREAMFAGMNPARGIQPYSEKDRTRFLQPAEFPALGAALQRSPSQDLKDFVKLALTTGARKMDVLSMRWQDVDLNENKWEIPEPKGGVPYVVPLTPEAAEVLKARVRNRIVGNPWVFPSKSKTGHLIDVKKRWKEMLKDAGLADADLRIHDLRRTQGSILAAQGTSLLIIGKSLGHRSVSATQMYSQVNLDAVRKAMEGSNSAMKRALNKKPKLKLLSAAKAARRA